MKCNTCGSTVDDGTTTCPDCGYRPGRSLVASGLTYVVLGYAIPFSVVGLSLVAQSGFGIVVGMVGVLAALPVVLYGLWLAFAGTRATVSEDLDGYFLPILW